MDAITFSDTQSAAIDKTIQWYNLVQAGDLNMDQVFQFTGYAGTGKTTCIQEIIARLGLKHVCFAAYTGKAALVMRQTSNVPAQTIHSLIYKLVKPDEQELKELQELLDKSTDPNERDRLFKEIEVKSSPHFRLNNKSDLVGAELLVLDECSMVDEDLLADLLSFKVPIVALGDPGQLPPVKGAGALFMGDVDVQLTEIHRQAQGNPIIEAATRARNQVPWPITHPSERGHFNHHTLAMIPSEQRFELMMGADQILCGMHKTRKQVNMDLRKLLEIKSPDVFPDVGDRLICRKNDRKEGLFNGLQGEVISREGVYNDYVEYMIQTEIADEPQLCRVHRAAFEEYYDVDARKNYPYWSFRDAIEWDFAYCLTVHVSQGSQWNNVILFDDGFLKGWGRTPEEKRQRREERAKWLYTAVTRAADTFTCIRT